MNPLLVALRSLARTPLVSSVAVVSLALGLGANAAIYSLYERLLLRPLPVEEPERLVNLLAPGSKSGSISSGQAGDSDAVWSYPMFRDIEAAELPFRGIAAEVGFGANLAYEGTTVSGLGSLVSGGYFETLGLRPALGRLLGPQDDRLRGGHSLAVLDHAAWQTRFGGDEGVLGEVLIVNGHPLTVVGVLPPEFTGRTVGARPQIYAPLTSQAQLIPGRDTFEDRRFYWLYVFGRLAPGVTPAAAEAAVNVPYRNILREIELPLQEGSSESYLERFPARTVVVEPGARGQSTVPQDTRAPLNLLFAVTGFVLLIAAANVANLLLVRSTSRGGEIAVRLAMGARRHQLVGLLLAESLVLAAAGGLLGLAVAHLTLRLFRVLLPAESDVVFLLRLDPSSWAFLAGLTLLTALVGIFPALHATRGGLWHALRAQSGRTSGSRAANRFRAVMASLQVALSMALLVAAGLFLRSLGNVSRVDLGIDVERLVTFGVSPELNGLDPEVSRALFERLESELAAIRGVTDVAASRVPLISGNNWGSNVSVQGFEAAPDADTNARFDLVGPGFFRTLGVPLRAGRELSAGDALGAPKVALVNEAFARKFGLGREAVGSFMAVGAGGELDIEIVGLVADAAYSEVKDEPLPVFYLPWRQEDRVGSLNFYLRSGVAPEALLAPVRAVVGEVAPNLPLENLATMEVRVRENIFLDRMLSVLSAGFALIATLLAALGLYGVIAYAVAQRNQEIGVRMALGAAPREVRRLVLRQVAAISGAGALVGLLAGAAVGRLARSILFRLDGHDPIAFAAALVLLALVAVAAGLGPARRAGRIDPVVALRRE